MLRLNGILSEGVSKGQSIHNIILSHGGEEAFGYSERTIYRYVDAGIFPDALSTAMQSLLWIMILLGRLCCASISSRMNKNLLILIMGIMMTFCFIFMISADTTVMIVVGLLGLGFFMSGIYPTTLSTMDSRYNNSTVATGTCIATATVGGILMPIIIGQVAEVSGIAGGVATISVALFFMVLLMVIKLIRAKKGLV